MNSLYTCLEATIALHAKTNVTIENATAELHAMAYTNIMDTMAQNKISNIYFSHLQVVHDPPQFNLEFRISTCLFRSRLIMFP